MGANFLTVFAAPLDSSWLETLQYRWGSLAFGSLAFLIFAGNYYSPPVECMTLPNSYDAAFHSFVKQQCWSADTYFVSMPNATRGEGAISGQRYTNYFKFAPLLLLIVAVILHAPRWTWKCLTAIIAVPQLTSVIKSAKATVTPTISDEGRESILHALAGICVQRHAFLLAKTQLTLVLLATKLCYVFGVYRTLHLLDKYLGIASFSQYFTLLRSLSENYEMPRFSVFPRHTVCEVQIRNTQNGNPQPLSISCNFSGNEALEFVFMICYLTLFVFFIINICSLVCWFFNIALSYSTGCYVLRHLQAGGVRESLGKAGTFGRCQLGPDGILMLKFISDKVGEATVTEIIVRMWQHQYGKTLRASLKREIDLPPLRQSNEYPNNQYFGDTDHLMKDHVYNSLRP